MKKQREKTEQGIERRVEKNRMEKIESKKEHTKKHRKGKIKNRVTYSSCLHDQQDLCWGNTSRDTSEELQVLHGQLYLHLPTFFVLALKTMLS